MEMVKWSHDGYLSVMGMTMCWPSKSWVPGKKRTPDGPADPDPIDKIIYFTIFLFILT